MVDVKKPKVPKPDKNIGRAAAEQTKIAKEMAALGREELEWNRQRFATTAKDYDRAAGAAFRGGEEAFERSDDLWSQWEANFAPVEEQFVNEAATFGGEADQAQQAQMARAGVAQAFEGQRGQLERDLARSGVNAASPAAIAARAGAGVQQAAAEGGASNMARMNSRLAGINMRGQVAQMGRQLQGMSSAERDAGVRNTVTGADVRTQQTAARNAGAGNALGYYSGAQAGHAGAAQTYAARDASKMQAYQAQASEQGALYGALGTLGGFAIMASSKAWKENMRRVAAAGVLDKIKRLDIEEWDYKADAPAKGRHIGPYAEDVHREFGEVVAPGGKVLDVISMHGVELAAIKELAHRMERLEVAHGG